MATTSDDPVGNLYSFFMAIDGAENKLEFRDKYLYILSAVQFKDNSGARKLSADFIGRLFKHFPEESERSIQALASLCVDTEAAIRKSATETLVEICRINSVYVKRVADLLIQMYGLADASEVKGLQQCLVKLLKIEPRQALEGLLDQIVTADEMIRQPAIRFLRTKLGELPPSANSSDIANLLVKEYRKILPEATPEEFENLILSLTNMKFFQTLNGGQMLVDLLVDCVSTGTPYTEMTPEQAERLITCCRLALPSFSRMIQSTKLVEYFCKYVIPSVTTENPDTDVPALQVFAELCGSVGDLKNYKEDIGAVLAKLVELLPQAPVDPAAVVEEPGLPKLNFSAVECLLCSLHLLGKRYPLFLTEPEQTESTKELRLRLQYFSSCMQLYSQKVYSGRLTATDADTIKKAEAVRRVIANIKSLILDLFHNPPHFKATVHLSWKKEAATAPLEKEKIQSPRTDGKIATKRKSVDDSNGSAAGKIRTKYPAGTGRAAAAAARTQTTTKATIRTNAPVADQAKLDARAKRFGGTISVASGGAAPEGTQRFTTTIKKI